MPVEVHGVAERGHDVGWLSGMLQGRHRLLFAVRIRVRLAELTVEPSLRVQFEGPP